MRSLDHFMTSNFLGRSDFGSNRLTESMAHRAHCPGDKPSKPCRLRKGMLVHLASSQL